MSVDSAFGLALRKATNEFIALSNRQSEVLEAHYRMLCRWNRKMNLTTVTALQEAVDRHYAESLFAAVHLPSGLESLADIGSGPGFPGIPIATVREDLAVFLIEANNRKAAFLREAGDALSNVRVKSVRSDQWLERADCLVSRAVRWEDVLALVPSNAPQFLLVLGEEDVGQVLEQQGFDFAEPIRIPWGEHRFLLSGTCSTWNADR